MRFNSAFVDGARALSPLLLGVIPFGLAFGVIVLVIDDNQSSGVCTFDD
jgi:predicted branched-subunit amino acid permease